MKWTDYFVERIYGAQEVVSSEGHLYVSKPIYENESVEVFFTLESDTPFAIWFRRRNEENQITDERLYGKAGTKRLAYEIANHVINLRVLSEEFVLDGE
jgi:hypothetical protein